MRALLHRMPSGRSGGSNALLLFCRLLEAAVQGPGWGAAEDVLRLLPGPGFEVVQAADEAGLPVERPAPPRPPPTGAALRLEGLASMSQR